MARTSDLSRSQPNLSKRKSYGSELRLRHKQDFERLQKRGRKIYATHFLIVFDDSPATSSRFAVAVTKKVEPRAAVRNRLRRRLKELFRLNRDKLTACFDILVIARKDAQLCEFAQVKHEVLGALRRAGVIAA